MPKVIYLTGAPASGKTTAAAWLLQDIPEIELFPYGAELAQLVSGRDTRAVSHDTLREKSSFIVSKEDIRELDKRLIEFVREKRRTKHVIIDSHPVTKEAYGFRITPFTASEIQAIDPTEIWILYANAKETIRRIRANPNGRRIPSSWEADSHTQLQSAVAITYSVLASAPVYLFDTSSDSNVLRDILRRRLEK